MGPEGKGKKAPNVEERSTPQIRHRWGPLTKKSGSNKPEYKTSPPRPAAIAQSQTKTHSTQEGREKRNHGNVKGEAHSKARKARWDGLSRKRGSQRVQKREKTSGKNKTKNQDGDPSGKRKKDYAHSA